MAFRKYHLKNYDFKLILLVLAICAVGYFAVGSAEETLQGRQLAGYAAGFGLMIFVSLFDYHLLLRLRIYWAIYGVMVALLVAVIVAGTSSHSAQRWFVLGGLQFQPSELSKILLILFFAAFIMKNRERLNTAPMLLACLALFAVPLILIFEQPDLSTSIMFALIFCVILFAGGLNWRIILIALLIAVPVAAVGISNGIIKGYQMNRLLAFQYPEEYPDLARQQNNSVTAIASGMLDGKGYRNNEITSVKNGNFLSEDQTDFIFAVIGEEFGFRGSALVVILLTLIALECIAIGRRASDPAGAIIGASMGALVGFQMFINIGVATFLLPNTGLPLPFVSYGLTSTISLFLGMGFVLNVQLQRKRGYSSAVEEIFNERGAGA